MSTAFPQLGLLGLLSQHHASNSLVQALAALPVEVERVPLRRELPAAKQASHSCGRILDDRHSPGITSDCASSGYSGLSVNRAVVTHRARLPRPPGGQILLPGAR